MLDPVFEINQADLTTITKKNDLPPHQTLKILKESITVCNLSFILSHLLSLAPVVTV